MRAAGRRRVAGQNKAASRAANRMASQIKVAASKAATTSAEGKTRAGRAARAPVRVAYRTRAAGWKVKAARSSSQVRAETPTSTKAGVKAKAAYRILKMSTTTSLPAASAAPWTRTRRH